MCSLVSLSLTHTHTHSTKTHKQNQGNQRLQVGLKSENRLLLRQAIECYGKGLALDCSSSKVNVALRNNRAHVNSLLGRLLCRCLVVRRQRRGARLGEWWRSCL